jgi:DNA-binding NtrC family response regulator
MPIRVLVAETDLHEHKVIHDILGVCLKDVRITRVLNFDSFLTTIRRAKSPFNMILYDYHFEESTGKNALESILKEKPELVSIVVLLNGLDKEIINNPAVKNIPFILKPYSLDKFSEVVKRITAATT